MRLKKRLLGLVLGTILSFGLCACGDSSDNSAEPTTAPTEAAAPADKTDESVDESNTPDETTDEEDTNVAITNPLASWKDGDIKTSIIDFVEAAVDENSEGYIPPSDRIVVTDIDGTLIAEKINKVNNDDMCLLTPEECKEHVKSIENDKVSRDHDWTYGKILYQPMKELYDYLIANDFQVFFVSGNCNGLTYAWANYYFDADFMHSIGSNLDLELDRTEGIKVVQTGDYEGSWCEVKVYRIYNQLGQCPVMAFGNSDGDFEMLEWVKCNDKYNSFSMMINHDDERESVYNVESISSFCEETGVTDCLMSENFEKIFID